MKIQKILTITDLPGDREIERSENGNIRMGETVYTADEAREIRDALTLALDEKWAPEVPAGARYWRHLDDIPADVRIAYDKTGDSVYMAEIRDEWGDEQRDNWTVKYGPFREVQ